MILAGLTFLIMVPPIAEFFARNALEVSFAYPKSDRPQSIEAFLSLLFFLTITQLIGLVGAIITGVGVLKRQRWSWYLALGLHSLIFVIHSLATLFLAPYETNARIAALFISSASIYLLSRTDVRNYLKPYKA